MRTYEAKSVCNGYVVVQKNDKFPTFRFFFVKMWDSINFVRV